MSDDQTPAEREAAAFRTLLNHPEVGMEAKRLYKKAVPNARFPDLDAEDRLAAVTKPLQDKIQELETANINSRVEQSRRENHAKCTAAGFDPAVVEKTMTDDKILNYDTAIKYLTAQQRNVQPSHIPHTPIKMPDNAKEIAKDPKGWANRTAHAAMDELIAARRA